MEGSRDFVDASCSSSVAKEMLKQLAQAITNETNLTCALIHEFPTPTLVIDHALFQENCKQMLLKANSWGVWVQSSYQNTQGGALTSFTSKFTKPLMLTQNRPLKELNYN